MDIVINDLSHCTENLNFYRQDEGSDSKIQEMCFKWGQVLHSSRSVWYVKSGPQHLYNIFKEHHSSTIAHSVDITAAIRKKAKYNQKVHLSS